MIGKHRVQIGDNTIRYDLVLSRNITIIRGDSGTGKTTLYNLIQEMNQKKNSGIAWNCDCGCYALTDFDWEDVIERHPKSIIFVDENFSSMRSEKFASIVNSADNYFVLITRAYLPMLAYSIKEVYSMHVSGKYATLNNEYEITVNELQNVYSSTLSYPPRLITPDYVLCEDSNSGLEMFHALAERVSAECHSAHGKSNIPEKVLDFEENKTYLIIVDGAAYGPEIDTKEFQVEKVITLPSEQYAYFTQHLMKEHDFIKENVDLMYEKDGVWHCLLVAGEGMDEGVLVESEGSAYARYSAFVPFAQEIIRQYQDMQETQTDVMQMKM